MAELYNQDEGIRPYNSFTTEETAKERGLQGVFLLPLNSRAIFYPGKTAGYARKNDVCNHFAKIDYLDIKICLAKPIKNQTSTTSTLTSFVTEALCPTAGSAGVSFNTASSVVGSIRFFRLGLHLHQNR